MYTRSQPSSTAVAVLLLLSMTVALVLAFPPGGFAHPGHSGSETEVPLIEQFNPGGDDPSVALPLGVLVGLLAVSGGLFALKGLRQGGARQPRGAEGKPAAPTVSRDPQASRLESGW